MEKLNNDHPDETLARDRVPAVPAQKYRPEIDTPRRGTFLPEQPEHLAADQGEHVPSDGCDGSIRDTSAVECLDQAQVLDGQEPDEREERLSRELHERPLLCQVCGDPEKLAIRFARPWWVVACREHHPMNRTPQQA